MATRNLGKHWISTPTEYLIRNLSQSAQEALDAVCAGSHTYHAVSWMDIYAIFRDSRQLVRDADLLEPSADGNLRAMVKVMRDNHAHLRRLLFLVAIENLFNLGSQNAREVLWTYGKELEIVNMISEHLAETGQEIAQVQAHFEAVFCQ
jgi:hypothetical protein